MKENLGIGNPCFVPQEALETGEFIKNDALFIKAVVEPEKTSTWPAYSSTKTGMCVQFNPLLRDSA